MPPSVWKMWEDLKEGRVCFDYCVLLLPRVAHMLQDKWACGKLEIVRGDIASISYTGAHCACGLQDRFANPKKMPFVWVSYVLEVLKVWPM